MGLLVLVVAGAILGWLGAIVSRIDERQDLLLNLTTGVVVAVLVGALMNNGALFGSLRPEALIAGLIGAIVALAALGAYRHMAMR